MRTCKVGCPAHIHVYELILPIIILLFPLNPATIHSNLENKATKIAALKQVFFNREVETTKYSNIRYYRRQVYFVTFQT